MKQVRSGKALEYGMIIQIEKIINCEITHNNSLEIAKKYYYDSELIERDKISKASNAVIKFLLSNDFRLRGGEYETYLQSDKTGKSGDVRDIIIKDKKRNHEIGLSLKNRHWAVKHSRLSESIDFGLIWLGEPNTDHYKREIKPIFEKLRNIQKYGSKWNELDSKKEKFYIPLLRAFKDELERLHNANNNRIALNFLSYLLGNYDFYKVIKNNGTVSVQSFNIWGSLNWGHRITSPTRIVEISFKKGSSTTLVVILNEGWQISFRIHNASSKVEPSLKFDIQIVGWPQNISRHDINY